MRQVQGTGQGGRITKRDLLAFLEGRQTQPELVGLPSSAEGSAASPPEGELLEHRVSAAEGKIVPSGEIVPSGKIVPLSPIRRIIAEHMVLSKHAAPHVTTVMEADLSRVIAHRAVNKDAFTRSGVNLTYTAYFVSAAVQALKAHPGVNSSWTDEGILLHQEINIGVATSLGEDGLIVPVIRNADALSLLGLARQPQRPDRAGALPPAKT